MEEYKVVDPDITKPKEVAKYDQASTPSTTLTPHVKNELSKYYTEEELNKLESTMSKETSMKIHESLLNLSNGAYSSIPRICMGRRCTSEHTCPFIKNGLEDSIIGKKCAVEIMLVNTWKEQYHKLLEDNGTNRNIVVDNYVSELIECDVISMRMSHYLGGTDECGGGEITENVFVINPKTVSPEYQKVENIALSIKGFVFARREKAIQALMASPYWKKKMADKHGDDDLNKNRNIFDLAKKSRDDMKEEKPVTDADYTVINDGDEPINY